MRVLAVKGDPKSLLDLPDAEVEKVREHLLAPLKVRFAGPRKVGLYLFEDGSWVVENFTDEPAAVEMNGKPVRVAPRNWAYNWR